MGRDGAPLERIALADVATGLPAADRGGVGPLGGRGAPPLVSVIGKWEWARARSLLTKGAVLCQKLLCQKTGTDYTSNAKGREPCRYGMQDW
jgi:hypothetical protein